MPAVSVVITTFNRADLLPRAIRSILRRTMGDFELIVVDDGSTDISVAPGFLPAYFHLVLSSGGWRWWRRISETRKLRSGRGGLVAL